MRLVRLLVFLSFLGIVGWLAVRSVSLDSSEEQVQITIDKRQLKAAGRDLRHHGSEAADKLGQVLIETGRKLNQEGERRESPD